MRPQGCAFLVALTACVGDEPAPTPAPAPTATAATPDAGPACTSLKGNYLLTNECRKTKDESCAATQTGCDAVFTCPSGAITMAVTGSTFSFSPAPGITCTGSSTSEGKLSGSCNGSQQCVFSGQRN